MWRFSTSQFLHVSPSHFIDCQRSTFTQFNFSYGLMLLKNLCWRLLWVNCLKAAKIKKNKIKKIKARKRNKNLKTANLANKQKPQQQRSCKHLQAAVRHNSIFHIFSLAQRQTPQRYYYYNELLSSFMLNSMLPESFISAESLNSFILQHTHICWLVFCVLQRSPQLLPGEAGSSWLSS